MNDQQSEKASQHKLYKVLISKNNKELPQLKRKKKPTNLKPNNSIKKLAKGLNSFSNKDIQMAIGI